VWKDDRHGLQAIALGGQETRQEAMLSLLEHVEAEHDLAPFAPALIHTNDTPVATAQDGWRSYAFCTAPGYLDVPVPDFVFARWPQVAIDDFDETCRAIAAAGERPAESRVAGWIGNCGTHPVRSMLLRLGRQHPDALDVRQVEWVGDASRGVALATSGDNAMSLAQQVARWDALIDVEGTGYSGRLKLLLHSGRPVLVADRPWREWWWDRLVPMANCVPVRRDLSDLVQRVRWLQANPHEAARIGLAGRRLAERVLTRASATSQWARTLALAARTPDEVWAPPHLQRALDPLLRRLGAVGGRGDG
jgi:Glycosyl transferase family 90